MQQISILRLKDPPAFPEDVGVRFNPVDEKTRYARTSTVKSLNHLDIAEIAEAYARTHEHVYAVFTSRGEDLIGEPLPVCIDTDTKFPLSAGFVVDLLDSILCRQDQLPQRPTVACLHQIVRYIQANPHQCAQQIPILPPKDPSAVPADLGVRFIPEQKETQHFRTSTIKSVHHLEDVEIAQQYARDHTRVYAVFTSGGKDVIGAPLPVYIDTDTRFLLAAGFVVDLLDSISRAPDLL
jgi:hypothetical protein